MSDKLNWKKLIQSNLVELTDCTHIGDVLVVSLYSKELIDDVEKDLFMDSRTPNIKRAIMLYTRTAKKWTDNEFHEFTKILHDTGNTNALQVLTAVNDSSLLVKTPDEALSKMKLLKKQKKKEEQGSYEGISLNEEMRANRIVEIARNSQFLPNGEVQLPDDVDKNEIIPLLQQFESSLKKEHVWWNSRKPTLPRNLIPRKVSKTNNFNLDGTVLPNSETKMLLEVIENFMLLVDSPGMGKSTEMTHLEQNLRSHHNVNRIIVRINLNEFQDTLSTISRESAAALLFKLAPFLPPKTLQIEDIRIFLLLDGLDEVCPNHQTTMLNILRIFKLSNEPRNLHVVLTTRPHLKEALEVEFNLDSFSLVPLSPEEQNSFMQSELNYSSEHLQNLRDKLSPSLLDLLANPLMLFMLVGVLKSEETFGATDLNLFDLYSHFVESKHNLQLIQKEGMKAEDNLTKIRVKSILERNLPFYYHVAWNELLRATAYEAENNELPTNFTDSIGSVATVAAPGLIATELLSYGLLVERGETKRLVFKHRSFAEYFYARLLLQPTTPQEVRDTLFGFIYGPINVLENVEEFVRTALSKTDLRLQLTNDWLLTTNYINCRARLLVGFVRGKLFSLAVREVLTTFLEGDHHDLRDSFYVLVTKRSREAFVKLVAWMEENKAWSRRVLLQKNSQSAARLTVAIGLTFEGQQLLTQQEVKRATDSLDHLISTLTSIHSPNINKWEAVGETKFRSLILTATYADLINLTRDVEGVWRLFSTFPRQELISLYTNEETRRTDLLAGFPLWTRVTLGEEFIPRLAEFTGKFGEDKGKIVFELDGCDFALGMLWEELLGEAEEKRTSGEPVTAALREAIGRRSAWEVLGKLEAEIRRRRSHPRGEHEAKVMEWVVDGGRLWSSLSSFPLGILPFVLRYSPSADHVEKTLKENEVKTGDKVSWEFLLKSLVISSHCPSSFLLLHSFLQTHLHSCPPLLEPLARLLLSAEREELQTATPSFLLVCDVSVGEAILALVRHPLPSDFSWVEVVSDVIRSARCCALRAILSKLRNLPPTKLRGILLSDDVLFKWKQRFTPLNGRKEEFPCGLRSLLTFYFSVFGLNLTWIEEGGRPVKKHLLFGLPVEMATSLEGNPLWTHLLPQFETYVRICFRSYNRNTLNGVAGVCCYLTEEEWERLIRMVGDEATHPGKQLDIDIPSARAAPLLRVLIRRFGVEETRRRAKSLWKEITPNTYSPEDSVQSKASLLHCAIQLGELEEVEQRAFPGLLRWRNSAGRNALEVAREELGEDHPITTLLNERSTLLKGKPAQNKLFNKSVVN